MVTEGGPLAFFSHNHHIEGTDLLVPRKPSEAGTCTSGFQNPTQPGMDRQEGSWIPGRLLSWLVPPDMDTPLRPYLLPLWILLPLHSQISVSSQLSIPGARLKYPTGTLTFPLRHFNIIAK